MRRAMAVLLVVVFGLGATACSDDPVPDGPPPDVVGERLDSAQNRLERLGYTVTEQDANGNRSVWVRSNWIVVEQSYSEANVHLMIANERDGPAAERRAEREASFVVPDVLGERLDIAFRPEGVRFDVRDIGGAVLPSRAGQRQRVVIRSSNWRVVAQCNIGEIAPAGEAALLGVVQEDEAGDELSAVGILTGEYNIALPC